MSKNKNAELVRYSPDPHIGLSGENVKERIASKQTNKVKKVVGKSYLAIFASNIFTFFNLIGLLIGVLMAYCGSTENMMFLVIILANTLIGIFQEIRSKITVGKLALLEEPNATVVRDGAEQTIKVQQIVLDDIVVYASGNQISVDAEIVMGEVEVNESLLTGESVAVKKKVGDTIFAGSYVVSGQCTARAIEVGANSYVQQLTAKAKKHKKLNSELMRSIKGIIKVISIILVPLAIGTFFVTYLSITGGTLNGTEENIKEALKKMAGSVIGMVPSGMVLLTSVALAVSTIKLVRKKVLVQELYCIEMLARVDTLCIDKTGTITDGSMVVDSVTMLSDKYDEQSLAKIIASTLNATKDDNMTAIALKQHFTTDEMHQSSVFVPFSSQRKYSLATLDGVGTVGIGAGEFMFKKLDKQTNKIAKQLLEQGLRVLFVGVSKKSISKDTVADLVPIAIVALQDNVRSDATEIIQWFKENNVAVKVISGDNPISVSAIAKNVGVDNAEKYISLDGMTDEEVLACANEYTVFGRVSPDQKALLVKAMKQEKHTVAMMGDGVNDILAMRESDCSVSVACGSDAAKSVAQLVLTDNQFGSMPNVVAEGRQVVNNIQNSSSLFLMKTSMTMLTTILMLILRREYPFQPQHLYAMEFFVIGITSFLLALKPNRNLIKGKFITNVLRRTLPSGVAMFLSVGLTYAFAGVLNISNKPDQLTTVAMFSMTAVGVLALLILLFPYDKINICIAVLSVVGTVGCYFAFPILLGLLNSILGKPAPEPMYVPIELNAVIFIICNALFLFAVMIVGRVLLEKGEKWKNQQLAENAEEQ